MVRFRCFALHGAELTSLGRAEAVGQSIDELLEETSARREAELAKEREAEELRLAAEKGEFLREM